MHAADQAQTQKGEPAAIFSILCWPIRDVAFDKTSL
jgi:hypothetical protein